MTKLQTMARVILIVLSILLTISCASRVRRQSVNEKILKLPNPDVCGPVAFTFGTKVIGGSVADLGEFPWMALLGYKVGTRPGIRWLCGGSLITDRFVISAAHCFGITLSQGEAVLTTVRLGELDRNPNVPDGADPQDYEVDKSIPHPQYDDNRKINDIALVRLKQRVTYTSLIKPICLPPAELYINTFVGENATVAGWGRARIDENGKTYADANDTALLKADLKIQDSDECRMNYTRKPNTLIFDNRVLCASFPGKDSCQGDSGGPLMFTMKTRNSPARGNHFLMGIVSYGNGCAKPGYPGVYTRVAAFMNWIIRNIDFDT